MKTVESLGGHMDTVTTQLPSLEIADRCDRCDARAYVSVLLKQDSPSSLLFCSHHFTEHELKLRALEPWAMLDERGKLADV